MEIINKFLTPNQYSRPCTKRAATTKVVVHYVGNPNTSADANRNYFENLRLTHDRYVSSNFLVGLNGEVICCVPDEEVAYCSNKANGYSISIEVCHPKSDGIFNDSTYVSLCELCAHLLKKYKLTVNDLMRHYDCDGANHKQCPLDWVPTKYQSEAVATYKWEIFKRDVQTIMNGGKVTKNNTVGAKPNSAPVTVSGFTPYTVRIIDDALNIRKDAGTQNPVVAVIKNKGVYTIVDEKKVNGSTWGLLKGYASGRNGWINVSPAYVKKV